MRLTDEQFLMALVDLLSDTDGMTQQEIDDELRAMGYDPDEIARHIKDRIEPVLKAMKPPSSNSFDVGSA